MKRSAPSVLFVFGRRVFLGDQPDEAVDVTAADSAGAAMAAVLEKQGDRGGRLLLVWEPYGFTHARVESPAKVDRKTFASLAEVAREHVAVVSDNLGWGFEHPKTDGSSVRTWLHAEGVPELNAAAAAVSDVGWEVESAWSLATPAFRLLSESSKGGHSQLIVCAPPFIAIFAEARGRGTRALCSSYNLEDDPARAAAFDVLSEGGLLDVRRRSSWLCIGSKADLEQVSDLMSREGGGDAIAWRESLFGAQRREWADISRATLKQRAGHPANLMESFPVPFPLGKVLRAGAVTVAIAAAVFAVMWFFQAKSARRGAERDGNTVASLNTQVTQFTSNKQEIEKLQSAFGGEHLIEMPKGRGAILRAMANAVPDAFSVTRFTLNADNTVDAQFLRVNEGGQIEALRHEWQRAGFVWNDVGQVEDEANSDEISVKGAWTQNHNVTPKAEGN